MSYRIKLLWKIVAELSPEGIAAVRPETGILFNRKGGRSLLRGLGGNFRSTYAPIVLQPTDVFHQAIDGLRKELGMEGNRFPVHVDLQSTGQRTRLNVSLHLYGTSVCATFSLDEFVVQPETDLARLQDLYAHPNLSVFASRILAITVHGDRHAQGQTKRLKNYPCIRIVAQSDDSASWPNDLVDLVTRHAGGVRIFDTVIAKNGPHQIDATLLLFDRQGLAGYVPFESSESSAQAHRQRFGNATSIIEYAAMLQKQLKSHQWLPEDVRQSIREPEESVPDSVSARCIWALAVKEFSLQTELKGWESASVRPTAIRVLVVTVTTVESRAVHSAFLKATGVHAEVIEVDGYRYQKLGRVGRYEIIHSISGMGTGGIGGAQESVRRSIEAIQPIALLMVGIAFGIDRDKQKIGEILVSRQVLMYELQRINKDFNINSRGDKITASPKLLDWVAHSEISWDESKPKIKAGLLLSGDKLVDNLHFRKMLTDLAPEAIGGEMEAAGVYVACQSAKIDWLVIKAICDWADGDKGAEKESNQALAAAAAAEFAVHLVKSQ